MLSQPNTIPSNWPQLIQISGSPSFPPLHSTSSLTHEHLFHFLSSLGGKTQYSVPTRQSHWMQCSLEYKRCHESGHPESLNGWRILCSDWYLVASCKQPLRTLQKVSFLSDDWNYSTLYYECFKCALSHSSSAAVPILLPTHSIPPGQKRNVLTRKGWDLSCKCGWGCGGANLYSSLAHVEWPVSKAQHSINTNAF